MAESAPGLERRHPLTAHAAEFVGRGTASFAALPEPYVAMVDVRLPGGGSVLGTDLPATPNTWVATDTGRAIWLGPDEWLLTSTTDSPEELELAVQDEVRPAGGAAADVSAQRISLRLNGTRVRELLAKGCAIDLHPRVFTPGSAVQTMLGRAGVILLAPGTAGTDDTELLVLVRSSFAGYLADWLLDAALEYADPAFDDPDLAPTH